jgi:hypothetical protein
MLKEWNLATSILIIKKKLKIELNFLLGFHFIVLLI